MPQFVLTSPEGKKYRVTAPDGATQEDAIKFVQSGKVPEMQAPAAQVAAPQEPQGFMQRVGQDINNRMQMNSDIRAATKSGQQTKVEEVVQLAGKVGAGTVMDIGGEVATSAFRALPDSIEQPIRDAGTVIGQSQVGQAVQGAIGKGVEQYQKFAESNPRAARNLEGVANLAAVGAPVKAPVTTVGIKPVKEVGDLLKKSATDKAAANKNKFVSKLVIEEETPSDIKSAGMRGMVDEDKIGNRIIEKTNFEKDMISEVEKITTLKKRDSLIKSGNKILKEARAEESSLMKALDAKKVAIPKNQFKKQLINKVARMVNDDPIMVGNAGTSANRLINEYYKILDTVPGTPSGLLQARKDFDSYLRAKKNVFDPEVQNAFNSVVREIRTSTNDFIASKVPDVGVKDSLRKQHLLLSAAENVATKYSKNQGKALTRLSEKVGKIATSRAAVGTGIGLAVPAAAAAIMPSLIPLALTSGAIVGGGKALTSVAARKAMGNLLIATDKAISLTKDKKVISQLRADRAAVLELIKSLPEEEPEEKPQIAKNPFLGEK